MINVSFKNCTVKLADMRNMYLMDVTLDDCVFYMCRWENFSVKCTNFVRSRLVIDESVGMRIPDEIAGPSWLAHQDLASDGVYERSARPMLDRKSCSYAEQRMDEWLSHKAPNALKKTPEGSTWLANARTPSQREHVPEEARHVARRGRFPFLFLPRELRDQMYGILLSRRLMHIADILPDDNGPFPPNHQLQLQYTMSTKIGQSEKSWQSTYLLANYSCEGMTVAILATCSQVHDEAAKVLYGQHISFGGTAEGALSWLHDTSRYSHLVRDLDFIHHFETTVRMVGRRVVSLRTKTDPEAFARLCDALVHKCQSLHRFHLVVGKEFWGSTQWHEGVGVVMQQMPSLLHLARLAVFDPKQAGGMHGNNGVVLSLHVHCADTPEKGRFLQKLRVAIGAIRELRPKVATQRRCTKCGAWTCYGCYYIELPEDEIDAVTDKRATWLNEVLQYVAN